MRKTFIGDLLEAMRVKEGFSAEELALMVGRSPRLVGEALELAIRQGVVTEERGRYRKASKRRARAQRAQLDLFGAPPRRRGSRT